MSVKIDNLRLVRRGVGWYELRVFTDSDDLAAIGRAIEGAAHLLDDIRRNRSDERVPESEEPRSAPQEGRAE